jgi:hypothetical protein
VLEPALVIHFAAVEAHDHIVAMLRESGRDNRPSRPYPSRDYSTLRGDFDTRATRHRVKKPQFSGISGPLVTRITNIWNLTRLRKLHTCC